jgi:hypothetical protein
MVDEPIEGEGFTAKSPTLPLPPPSVPVRLGGSEVGIDPTGPFMPNLPIIDRILGDHESGVLGEVVSATQKAGGSVLPPSPKIPPPRTSLAQRARRALEGEA